MSLNKLKSLQDSYSSMRLLALGSLLVAVIAVVGAGSLVAHAYGVVGQRVYVVGNGGTTAMALADSPENHTDYEMRNLVLTFALNMFAHDQYTYRDNLNRALPLIDDLGQRRLYADFKKADLFGNYTKFGARTMITVDSIVLDTKQLPVRGRLYMRQKGYIGDRQSQSLPLGCSFDLTNTQRSKRNPFGMMLTRFDYFPYTPGVSDAEKKALQAQADRDAAELAQAKEAAEAAKKQNGQ